MECESLTISSSWENIGNLKEIPERKVKKNHGGAFFLQKSFCGFVAQISSHNFFV